MPSPTPRDVHTNAALTQFSIAYKNGSYIYDQVFPTVQVAKQTDFYYVFDKSSWFRNIAAKRAPGTRAQRAGYSLTTASYVAINYALATEVPDEMRANADNPLRPDIQAVDFVTDALLRAQEKRVADLITASSNWAYNTAPSPQWTNDTSTPLTDIDGAINAVISTIGQRPNIAVMSWDVWRYLKNHPDMLDRVKYTRPGGTPVPGDLASLFNFDKVLVGMSLVDSSVDGNAASMSYVWADGFWCGYVAPNPS